MHLDGQWRVMAKMWGLAALITTQLAVVTYLTNALG